jgi:heptosyltransferase-1
MKIAIVKLSAMGDIIHAMVVIEFIKKAYPNIKIDWIVEQTFIAVLQDNPYIDNILPLDLKQTKKNKKRLISQIKLVRYYAQNKYDLIIDAQGLLKSAIVSRLLGKNIAGFSKNSIREKVASYFYSMKVDISYASNTIDRNAKVIGEPLGIKIDKEMILNKKPFLFFTQEEAQKIKPLLSNKKKNILYVIGSTWESRNYPKEKFAQVAKALDANSLIVWGNAEEKERAQWIASQVAHAQVAPKLSLNELKALIAHCDLLIGNDTGPTHMAWALNIPSITIFGPTPVSRVYQTPINRVIKSPSKIDPYKLNKEDFSIRNIAPQKIIELSKELLYDQ